MYNRYLSDDSTPYTPVTEVPGQAEHHTQAQQSTSSTPPPPTGFAPSPAERIQQLLGFGGKRDAGEGGTPLRRLLARFHLEDVDTGDLLLLILLFFLLEEKADDELLIALGILLIL